MIDGTETAALPRPPFVDMGSAPRYLPHCTHPEILTMGLGVLDGAWIDTNIDLSSWRSHKQRQRDRRGNQVYRVTDDALSACAEVADLIAALPGVSIGKEPPDSPECLWEASLGVAEDLVVMRPSDAGYRLSAASLCSPSHWRLEDKFDRPIDRIHDPIPGIHDALGSKIQRFFERLKLGVPVQRFNWSLQADSDVFAWPSEDETPVAASTPLYYRVERQTLRRLPISGAVLFTIRVYLHPLDCLRDRGDALAQLLTAVDATPAPLAEYKDFPRLAPALARYRQ